MYVQYGAGLSGPETWENFDASPTLRLQRLPLLGALGKLAGPHFPANVRYGDIIKGLPVPAAHVEGAYASHVLEHLSYEDAIKALQHTYSMLKSGGIFRCVVPDLAERARRYVDAVGRKSPDAAHTFLRACLLGAERRSHRPLERIRFAIGNSAHLWMWDQYSLQQALEGVGFQSVRRCRFGDSDDPAFEAVEEESRFIDQSFNPPITELAMEAVRP